VTIADKNNDGYIQLSGTDWLGAPYEGPEIIQENHYYPLYLCFFKVKAKKPGNLAVQEDLPLLARPRPEASPSVKSNTGYSLDFESEFV
jgi:hypothetical protein